jgi:hypothetical protein
MRVAARHIFLERFAIDRHVETRKAALRRKKNATWPSPELEDKKNWSERLCAGKASGYFA